MPRPRPALADALHHQIMAWKADLPPKEWSRLTVLVIGRHLPRKGNLAVEYFARPLGEPGEGKRIIYAEGLGDEPRAASTCWPPTGLTPRSALTSSMTRAG